MRKSVCFVLLALVIVVSACGPSSPPNYDATHTAQARNRSPSPVPVWAPSGFRGWGGGLAWRFLEDSEYSCSYSGWGCGGIMVVSLFGCQDLYAEVTVLDIGGSNIGWTNDTASGVQAGEEVKLVFDFTEDDASAFRLSELSCY